MSLEIAIKHPSRKETLDNFWGLIDNTIQEHGDKEYIITTAGRLTYQEANQRANCICAALKALALPRQIGVGLFMKDALKVVPSMLGTLKAEHYFIPLDPNAPITTIQAILSSGKIKIIITSDEYLQEAQNISTEEIILINHDTLDLKSNALPPNIKNNPEDWVQILYTSGSTGEPKGAIEDYRYLANAVYLKMTTSNLSSSDRFMQIPNFTFSGPHTIVFGSLFIGMTICFYSVKDEGLAGLSRWLNEEKVTYYGSTATIFRTWAGTLDKDEIFPNINTAHIGSEKRTPHDIELLKRHFPNVNFIRLGFASTETQAVASSLIPMDYKFEDGYVPCGIPNEGIKVFIRDEQGHNLPIGAEGEIVVYGDALARGYINNPELTRERFIPAAENPIYQYFRTGDLGKIREDGQLIHIGRIDNMVKIKGIRIELNTVEKHMLDYPGILQTAFRVFDDHKGNKKLTAYFIAEKGIQIPVSDLRKFLSSRLPIHLLPHFFIQLDEFPMTRTSKLDRNQLPHPTMTRPPLSNPYVPPANKLESTLVDIWEDEIGVEGIGVTDDFFEIGGDSLIGVVLFIRIEQELERNLPVSTLLKASTIRRQAEIISEPPSKEDFSPLITIKPEGKFHPLFFIPGKGGYPTRIRHLAKLLDPEVPVYALQDLWERPNYKPLRSIESMAAFYLNEIKKVSPHGPYILIGESLGGKIALEIAQLFCKQGFDVPILALLDTYNFEESLLEKGTPAYYKMLLEKHLSIFVHANRQGRADYIKFYWEALGNKISQRIRRYIRQTRTSDLNAIVHERESRNLQVVQRYIPSAYPGKVILFKALRGLKSNNPSNGWDKVELGELAIHPLDCYHGSILFEPAVSELARVLNTYINNNESVFLS